MNMSSWKAFINNYVSDNGYWYIPKGLTVKEDNFKLIKKRLTILKEYEGSNWSKVQSKFVKSLSKNDLFERRVDHEKSSDNAAIGRMFKVVVSNLGLAWINEDENVYITEVGNKIIASKDNKSKLLINNQIKRFQFYNPSFLRKDGFHDINVIPIEYLSELLYELNDKYISKEEYILFVAKKKSHDEITKSINEIYNYRNLSESDQKQLISTINKIKISSGSERRSSIYNTILLESPYALNFFSSSGLFSYSDSKLTLSCSKNELKNNLKSFKKNNVWIDFNSHKDWFYYYGQLAFDSPVKFAIDYYLDISDVDNALKIYKKVKKLGITIPDFKIKEDEFKTVIVDEKILEDFLEKHITELESDLKLLKDGRQFPTVSGPIDLLAKDSKGNYVIIELKKGRIADKVIGQVSRYAAYVGNNLTTMNKVRAIIVGKNIDRNLCLSVQVLRFNCNLYEFDYKVKFERKSV